MSRKRKPVQMTIAQATEAILWRARILCEMLDALEQPVQMQEPIKRMKEALSDFEASKTPTVFQLPVCDACKNTCTERRHGLCNRCQDAAAPALLNFAEMQP